MDLTVTMESCRRSLARASQQSEDRLRPLLRELIAQRERLRDAVTVAAAELTEFARGDRAGSELRTVQRRVDRGELSWQRVALGEGDILAGLLGDRLARLPEAFARAYTLVAEGVPPEEAARQARALLSREGDAAGPVDPDRRAGR
ncbi:MAG: hypothetical protein FWJ93_04840 [Micromonosporaceae bacterium]